MLLAPTVNRELNPSCPLWAFFLLLAKICAPRSTSDGFYAKGRAGVGLGKTSTLAREKGIGFYERLIVLLA